MDVNAPVTDPSNSGALPPATAMGPVRLKVAELDNTRRFYEQVLGLQMLEQLDGLARLGAGGTPLVELHGDSSANLVGPGVPGLYHQAILMPDRRSLALALTRVVAARWPLSGASDHLVSEALYLSDPEGNGIEIYRDRPREEWSYRDGQLAMATLPLDLDDLVGELGGSHEVEPHAPPGARMGHVHLQVSDIELAEDFYSGILGFEVMVRGYPGALFVSAGGYHHHLGLNTWQSHGAAPRRPGMLGLERFEVVLPGDSELERLVERIRGSDVSIEREEGGWITSDPFGNQLLLRSP